MKFGVNIPNTLGEINGNVAWKLENVVTTLNKTISNINTLALHLFLKFLNEMQVCSFFIVDEIFRLKLTLSVSFSKVNFSKFHVRHL